jgi:cation:H+ antiporter
MFDFLAPLVTANWFTAILFLLIGIGFLWSGSELAVRKLTPIAKFFGVREIVITILGISVMSSLPEFTVSFFANLQGNSDISIGNIIGSNFVTLTFVTALCALIKPMEVHTDIRNRESSWMILSTVLIFILARDGELGRLDGIILVAMYIPYIISVIKSARQSSHEDTELKQNKGKDKKIALHIMFAVFGVLGVIAGANITLLAGQDIGARIGISPLAMGVLIFAFGTSLPELSVALSATFKHKAEVSIGEIYASNIFTAMFVLGLCAIAMPMPVSTSILNFDIPFLILAGTVIQIFVTTGNKLQRIEAVFILAMYIYFTIGHFLKVPFFS